MHPNVRNNGVVIVSNNTESDTCSLPWKSPTFYITNQFCRVRYIERLLYFHMEILSIQVTKTITNKIVIKISSTIVLFILMSKFYVIDKKCWKSEKRFPGKIYDGFPKNKKSLNGSIKL
jgi:hypothetical protein